MPDDLVLDLPVAPDAALARLAGAINEPPRRAFGVLKTSNEFVGAIAERRFEVWERRQRAVHAVGSVEGRRGGSRVTVAYRLSPVARVLLVAFFVLYAVVALGIATQPPDPAVSAYELVVSVVGAAVVGGLFYGAARRQRRDLGDFLGTVFSAPRRS